MIVNRSGGFLPPGFVYEHLRQENAPTADFECSFPKIQTHEGDPMPYKAILVGTGGQGRAWCARFLPPNVADGRVEVVAAIDINQAALQNAQEHLGLASERCYTDMTRAFAENPAD